MVVAVVLLSIRGKPVDLDNDGSYYILDGMYYILGIGKIFMIDH